jgi:hypothetical protein
VGGAALVAGGVGVVIGVEAELEPDGPEEPAPPTPPEGGVFEGTVVVGARDPTPGSGSPGRPMPSAVPPRMGVSSEPGSAGLNGPITTDVSTAVWPDTACGEVESAVRAALGTVSAPVHRSNACADGVTPAAVLGEADGGTDAAEARR